MKRRVLSKPDLRERTSTKQSIPALPVCSMATSKKSSDKKAGPTNVLTEKGGRRGIKNFCGNMQVDSQRTMNLLSGGKKTAICPSTKKRRGISRKGVREELF